MSQVQHEKKARQESNKQREKAAAAENSSNYKPIEDYGIIGDFHTAALVGKDGSIDWCCMPDFDSPSVFASILDAKKGGYFKISSNEPSVHKQMYLPETCVLLTRFLSADGIGEVLDFMPFQEMEGTPFIHQIIRIARVVSGRMRFRLECFPAFDYARAEHELSLEKGGAVFHSSHGSLGLTSPVRLHASKAGVNAEFDLKAGESAKFLLRFSKSRNERAIIDTSFDFQRHLDVTMRLWRNWVSGINYQGRWREMVQRSAMTLKLLVYKPTGAIVASPTTSLPETIGGVRNYDYRYTWVRDATFTVDSFLKLGLTAEAEGFMSWLTERAREAGKKGHLQVMYGINGQTDLREYTLPHLEGYRGSSPVRVGNAAHSQLQLDIYGELMNAVYLSNQHSRISYDLWMDLRRFLDYVDDNWKRKDHGIWEMRGKPRHFTYSKLMCWVALDRGIRLAENRGFPSTQEQWRRTRDNIYEEIMQKAWNKKAQSFVQSYGSTSIDAANLIMPLTFFIAPNDPRMLATLQATKNGLVSDSLVHRYQVGRSVDDGFKGKEGAFSMCTFWFVECLAQAGQVEEARFIFEKMHSYSNHLGLYSEEIGPIGEHLGNFPQAFTHLSLITAAINLDKILD